MAKTKNLPEKVATTIERSPWFRLLRIFEVIAVFAALIAFGIELNQRQTDREVRIANLQSQLAQTLALPDGIGQGFVSKTLEVLIDEGVVITADLSDIVVQGADFTGAMFYQTNLAGSSFTQTNFTNTLFIGSSFFSEAPVEQPSISRRSLLRFNNFTNAVFDSETTYLDSYATGNDFSGAIFEGFALGNAFLADFERLKIWLREADNCVRGSRYPKFVWEVPRTGKSQERAIILPECDDTGLGIFLE
ncbi:MAG: pentapeptide repeat-containing protein [Pseudomonadota bacterium]